MIIVSQNRQTAINLETMHSLYIHDGIVYAADGTATERIRLGAYSSDDRAKEVLKKITDTYGRYIFSEGGPMLTMEAYVQPMAFNPPKVYEMPEE